MSKWFSLNSRNLKIIAMVIILLDHIGYFFVPAYGNTETLFWILRGIGRLGFPLYAFFIVEGIIYSRNIPKYLLKILALALGITLFQIIAFFSPLKDYFYINEAYNIFLTLFTGASTVAYFHLKKYKHVYLLIPLLLMIITNSVGLFVPGTWHILLVNEYRIYGIAIILGFYLARRMTPRIKEMIFVNYQGEKNSFNTSEYNQKINNYLSSISLLFVNLVWYILSVTNEIVPFDGFQTYSIFAGVLILVYNGTKGYQPVWFRWFYYLYYPLHLGLIAVISLLI